VNSLLRDSRARRLVVANLFSSVGSGITIIAVPWLLVNREGGNATFGWTTFWTTVVLFLFIPYYGAWVDRHSRKTMLLWGEVFGFGATFSMALVALVTGRVETWQLVATFFCGWLYYTLHYPAKFAFVQQIFDRSQYQALTSMMEVQGQVASMAAGGLASVLIGKVDLSTILLVDASSYLVGFALMASIPYEATHLKSAAAEPAATNAWHAVAEAWRWLAQRRALLWFFICSFTPFLAVMVSNYLFPIYVAQILQASPGVYGVGEMAFAGGAVLAGLSVPLLTARIGQAKSTVALAGVFIAGSTLLILWPVTGVFYAALLLMGLGNAGVRVARNVIVLHLVPNAIMGRVNVFFAAFERFWRTVLILTMTLGVDHLGARVCLGILLALNLLAFAGLLLTRHAAEDSGHGA
jgi:MFS family permease